MSASVQTTIYREQPAISLRNSHIELIVVAGGGHIAAIRPAIGGVNALWEPHWPTLSPSLRNLTDPDVFGDTSEGKLLSSLVGHNLCLDVFGGHSKGEEEVGMTFHGEAGMVTWECQEHGSEDGTAWFVMTANLPHTCLEVERRYTLAADARTVQVEETIENLTGFQRALGRSQHVTVGRDFLSGGCLFSCNADLGHTWPEAVDDPGTWAVNKAFTWPDIPNEDGTTSDWRLYPRVANNSDLCTLRINPADANGWLVAAQNNHNLALVYTWERAVFPWLMTWEENYSRLLKPWNGKELTRGLEFGSYAYASSRQANVEMGTLLDTPTFEWIDAYEEKTTLFSVSLFDYEGALEQAPVLAPDGDALTAAATGWRIEN